MPASAHHPLPPAILFDLDDTLISAHTHPRETWRHAIETLEGRPESLDPEIASEAIHRAARWFWSDPVRHKDGRLNILNARRGIIGRAFEELGRDDPELIDALGVHFTEIRWQQTALYPDAIDTLVTLRERGVKLGLITNGNAMEQRRKIDRFALVPYFDHIQIEGEMGFGKPEEQAYAHALTSLGHAVEDTWIIGDNLSWEVIVPQKLGFHAIWRDPVGQGLPADTEARPDRILTRLAELVEDID